MKATLERTDLLKSLTHVHRVVERRNTIPILSNVLLRADGGAINLKATDLDLEIVESVPAMIELPGATTVPAHMFYDIVRKLPEGSQVVLETTSDNATLEIRAGRSKFTLQMLPETDFPDLTAGDFSHGFALTGADIRKLIDATQFAISTEETRYYLNGIYLHTVDAGSGLQFRAVATDGHRLAQAEVPAPSGSAGMPEDPSAGDLISFAHYSSFLSMGVKSPSSSRSIWVIGSSSSSRSSLAGGNGTWKSDGMREDSRPAPFSSASPGRSRNSSSPKWSRNSSVVP